MQHFRRENCKWLLSLFEDIDECLSLPCTHGTCHNSMGSYSCTCESGWTGFNCDTGIYVKDGVRIFISYVSGEMMCGDYYWYPHALISFDK